MRTHTHTHRATHSSRRHGQIFSDMLEPSREPPCTINRGGQNRKPVSHVEALGQLYKTWITRIHKHNVQKTHNYPHKQEINSRPLCCSTKLFLFTDEKYPKSFVFLFFFLTDFPEIYSMNSPDKSRPLRNVQRNAEIKSGVHMDNSTFGLVAPQKLRLWRRILLLPLLTSWWWRCVISEPS